MSGDKLIYDLSQEIEGSPNVFIKKDWLNILDNQNGNYSSNQSCIDTSQLSNSNKYMSYREAYLSVPLLLTLSTAGPALAAQTMAPAAAATSCDYALGLKNWFGTIIHSFTLDYNGVTIVQQTPFINLWNNFKLMTSLSWSDVTVIGSTIGFYPDRPTSWGFFGSTANGAVGGTFVSSPAGQGTCNNVNYNAIAPVNNLAGQFIGNIGFLQRQQYINYDPTAATPTVGGNPGLYQNQFNAQSCNAAYKSYISNKVTGGAANNSVIQISVMATIYLKHIASFFSQIPLLKGVFLKMTLNLNNTTTNFQAITNGANPNVVSYLNVTQVQNAVGGTNPLMISAAQSFSQGAAANCGSANLDLQTVINTAVNYVANVSVGATCLNSTLAGYPQTTTGALARSIFLYCPAYSFNPVFEQAYLSSPIKSIKYTDVYQYQVLNVGYNTSFNNLLTNGIADLRSVLLIPFYSSTATGQGNNAVVAATPGGINPSTQLPVGMPVYQSPFDTAGGGTTSPLCLLGNFNVVVSGQNAIYNTQRYSFEEFNNQLYGCNSVNSGMTDGLNSGLINSLGFEMMYSYYYVNVSRMLPVEQSVPKSVQIMGQNLNLNSIDLYCFLEYGASCDIDVLTGARV